MIELQKQIGDVTVSAIIDEDTVWHITADGDLGEYEEILARNLSRDTEDIVASLSPSDGDVLMVIAREIASIQKWTVAKTELPDYEGEVIH